MPRNGSGGYDLPTNSWNPAVNGASATSTDYQALINDVETAIQQSVSADGQTPITGDFNFGGYELLNFEAESDLINFTPAGAGAVETTVQSKLREGVSVFDFMTAAQIADVQSGALSLDVTSAIQAALVHAYSLTTAAPNGWRYNTCKVILPRGKYKVAQANALFVGLSAFSGHIIGDGKSGVTEIVYDVAAPASTDYLIKNNDLFGFIQFENIKFRCANANGANQNFMLYNATSLAAQNITFNDCNFYDWTNLIQVGSTVNASENTFYNCHFYNISGVGFDLNNSQAVNWRFYACDAEIITGILFQFTQGATVLWSQGSVIPSGTSGRVIKVPSGADSNAFGPGNTPCVIFHGTRFEMRTGSLMVEKVNSPTKFAVVFDGCGMGGLNVTDPATWKMFTWTGAGNITINNCYNLVNYRISHSVAGTSDNQLFVKMTNSDAPKEFITSSTFTVTGGSTNNVGYTPMFDIQACNSQIDGKYRAKDSEYNYSSNPNYRGVVKELHGVSFSSETKALAITAGATFNLYVPPTRVLAVEIYPLANVSGAGNATVTVKNAAGTVTLATHTWALTAPVSVKLSADCNYLVDSLAGDYLTVQFAHDYTPGVVQAFFGQLYLKY
jgi:hypothetical protein